jgi:hypothetical protein
MDHLVGNKIGSIWGKSDDMKETNDQVMDRHLHTTSPGPSLPSSSLSVSSSASSSLGGIIITRLVSIIKAIIGTKFGTSNNGDQ